MPNTKRSEQQHENQDEPVLNSHPRSAFLQFEKLRATEAYFQSLQGANERSLQYFRETIYHTSFAFLSSIILYALTYLISLSAIVVGLILLFDETNRREFWAGGCIMGGIILLIIMINRDPIRNSYHLINNLARLNIVFTGYVRQIHQIDATFRGMYMDIDHFELDQMEAVSLRIQEAMENALEGVNRTLEDLYL